MSANHAVDQLRGSLLGRAVDASHLRWRFDPRSTGRMSGAVRSRSIGPLRVRWLRVDLGLGHWWGERGAAEIAANPEPYLIVVMPLDRAIVLRNRDREITVSEREFAIWDSTREMAFRIESPCYEQISLMVPQRALRASAEVCAALHCSRVDETNILSDLCVKHIATLAEFLDEQLRPYELSLTHVTTSLIDAVIASLYRAPRDRDVLLNDIKSYIECYIDDESMSPRTIARAFEISPRYLHKLFSGEEATVGQWIIARRLERSAGELLDSAAPVTDIAFKWGFKALGHYSRAFKQRFGLSPSQYRHAGGARD